MAENTDFILEQQRAIERMKEMSSRSTVNSGHTMPPAPPFVKINDAGKENPDENRTDAREKNSGKDINTDNSGREGLNSQIKKGLSFLGLDLPFFDKFKQDPDVALILGLLLLLWSDRADKKLLLALLYIML